jgi:hypothetical protein
MIALTNEELEANPNAQSTPGKIVSRKYSAWNDL